MAILEEELSARKEASQKPVETMYREVRLTSIAESLYNPRDLFDPEALESLADSIRQHGILEPLVVRRLDHSPGDIILYGLIAGERRFRAAKMAGLEIVPVLVKQGFVSDESALVMTLIENLQREQLNPMEAARGYQQLTDMGYSQERIVKECGGSVPGVSNTLGLLKLPLEIQQLISVGSLSFSHGKLLRSLIDRLTAASTRTDDAVIQAGIDFAQEIADGGWPIKRMEAEIERRFPKPAPSPALLDVPEDPAGQSGFAPPEPLPLNAHPALLNVQGDNAPKSAAETLAALNQERDETVKGWNDAADDDADQPAPAADVDPAGEGREDVPAERAEGGPVPGPAAGADAAQPAGDADPQHGRGGNPATKPAGNPAPVPAPAKNPATPVPAVKPPAPIAQSPNSGATIAQPAGTVSHTILLPAEIDDWLWDKNWTPLEAITAMHRIVSADLYLTPEAEKAAQRLTDEYNQSHPDAPVSIAERIESVLVVRANAQPDQDAQPEEN